MSLNFDFPFTISDVASLLDLRVRRRMTDSMYVDCPFCNNDKKGKMNINFVKNAFRCNYNEEHAGGMVELYARYHGVSRKDAYREICESLRTGMQKEKAVERQTILPRPATTVEAADLETRHQTYSMLFNMLVLTKMHRDNLNKRGLTNAQISEQGYCSTPAFGFKQLAKRLLDAGCVLEGVPGFYQTSDGDWIVNFTPRCSGIIIPVLSIDGRIQGAQIRLDRPFDDCKYIWFSSSDKPQGAGSGSPVHFIGDPQCKTVYITEGALKGNIIHSLTGKTVLCVAGVTQSLHLREPLIQLRQIALTKVIEAYDMDKHLALPCACDYSEKCESCAYRVAYSTASMACPKKIVKRDNIQRCCNKLLWLCHDLHLEAKRLTWDKDSRGLWAGRWKGLDDFELAVQLGEVAELK